MPESVDSSPVWVGRFAIQEGEVREEGQYLGVISGRRSRGVRCDLYIVAEPALPNSGPYCGQLIEFVGGVFRKERLSITGALVRALQLSHERLRDWNEHSLREHQIACGVSCLAVQGSVAYLAQVGPSLAFYRQGDNIRRLIPISDEAVVPLGFAERFAPHLSRLELAPNDFILLTLSSLSSVVDDDTLADILSADIGDVLPRLYAHVRHLPEFAAMLVAIEGSPAERTQLPTEPDESVPFAPAPEHNSGGNRLAELMARMRRWWTSLGLP